MSAAWTGNLVVYSIQYKVVLYSFAYKLRDVFKFMKAFIKEIHLFKLHYGPVIYRTNERFPILLSENSDYLKSLVNDGIVKIGEL